jgi:hypothetical protein
MIGEEELAPAAFARDLAASESYVAREEEHREVPEKQIFNEHLETFASMSDERRLVWDPYHVAYEDAERQIVELTIKLVQYPDEIGKIFNHWLFAPIDAVPFLQNLAPFESLSRRLSI